MANRDGFVPVTGRRNHNPNNPSPRTRYQNRRNRRNRNGQGSGKVEATSTPNDENGSELGRSDNSVVLPHRSEAADARGMLSDRSEGQTKKLIILDIFGILCWKVMYDKYPEAAAAAFAKENNLEHISLRVYSVFIRPGVREFLSFCYEYADVGFFSSTTEQNARAVLDLILTYEQRMKTKFFWYRDRTKIDPDYGINPEINDYDTVKILADVLQSPYINPRRVYDVYNTVICDDTPRKMKHNNRKNVLMIPPFDICSEIEEWQQRQGISDDQGTTVSETGQIIDHTLSEIFQMIPERFDSIAQLFVAHEITRGISKLLDSD